MLAETKHRATSFISTIPYWPPSVPTYSFEKIDIEWLRVTTGAGEPHVVATRYLGVKVHGRAVPHCPLHLRGGQGFRYSVAFMDAVAAALKPGLTYVGIVYEGSVSTDTRDVPAGGCDILSTRVYWQFPAGAVRCLSVRDLTRSRLRNLAATETRTAYEGVAAAFGYTFLGHADDPSALESFAQASGTWQDRAWETRRWGLPPTALSP